MLNSVDLRQFTGSESFTRYSPLFRKMLLSEGALHVAENGGTSGAYWLMDAISSHQPEALRNAKLREMQFWKLKVNANKSALLTCCVDSGKPAVIKQEIEYTDFDLPEIEIWVAPTGDGIHYTIFLPSEY